MQPCPTFRDSLYTISMYPYTGLVYYSQKDQLPRAPSVGRRNSTRVDDEERVQVLSRKKMPRDGPSWERGRRACYATPGLTYD